MDPQYFGEPIPDASFTVRFEYALLCLLRSTSSPPEPTLNLEFFGTDLGSEESDSHHGAACLGEDRRDDRNDPHNIAKIKVDKFADLLSLTLFCDIYASSKSSMQGVFTHTVYYDFAEGP